VPGQTGVDPGAGGLRVEISHEFGVPRRVTGQTAPYVRADLILAALAGQIPGHLAAGDRGRAGGVLELVCHLPPKSGTRGSRGSTRRCAACRPASSRAAPAMCVSANATKVSWLMVAMLAREIRWLRPPQLAACAAPE
jgi:hypothetical protein